MFGTLGCHLQTIVLLLFVTVSCTPDWADVCPNVCRCKWSSGKKTALCRDAGFTAPPGSLSTDTQVLDLSGNAVPYLAEDAFSSVGLLNLQRIYIRKARVREIHYNAFRDLVILIEVDLSGNLITSLHPDTFTGNVRLRVICLSGNPLRELQSMQFPALPHLRSIELQHCELSRITRDAFSRVTGVEMLDLQHNKLTNIEAETLTTMPRLKTLALDSNPWRCDCFLRAFRDWLLSGNLYPVIPKCTEPAVLSDRSWRDVPSESFACAPHVSLLTDTELRVAAGANVTLVCRVRGDPEPSVSWLHDDREINVVNDTFVTETKEILFDKWINISMYNVDDADAGDYTCVARNARGTESRKVTLIIPQVAVVSSVTKADESTMWMGVACGIIAALSVLVMVAACTIIIFTRQRKRYQQRMQPESSVSFTDQDKKLIDSNIETSDRVSTAASCDTLEVCHSDIDVLEKQIASVECPTALIVYPPPPAEFSTDILPACPSGNIFISVSVRQESQRGFNEYPDLLDISRDSTEVNPSSGVAGMRTDTDILHKGCHMVECYCSVPRQSAKMESRTHRDDTSRKVTSAEGQFVFSVLDDNPLMNYQANKSDHNVLL